jgi:hypothetical protein
MGARLAYKKIIFRRQSLSVLQKVYLSLWLWGKWVELVQKRFLRRVFARGWNFGLKAAILARFQETRARSPVTRYSSTEANL